ncbi:MAG: hypothetical protein JXA89_04445 [Anaerolineae bacterium]|nr:hypothetical protein [Anaerolineae bacterium]
MGWTKHVPKQIPLDWLLELDNPSVRALALIELLDRDAEDAEVVEARKQVADAPYIARILKGQHAKGYWSMPERYFHRHTGTAWRWLLLHELGFDPMHPQMLKTADFLLDIAFNDETGAFSSQPGIDSVPCYNGWLLWGLHRSGYGDDPRVHSALRWVVDKMRYDDGDNRVADPDNGCWGRHVCVRGVIPILRALSELPDTYRSEETVHVLQTGIEFMLLHHVYKRSHNLDKPMNSKLTQLTFPSFYWPDFVEVLLILTHLECGDPRMEEAIAYLQKKQAKDGTWTLQRTYNERSKHDTFPVVIPLEARGAPSKWVTLRALIVLKRWFGA